MKRTGGIDRLHIFLFLLLVLEVAVTLHLSSDVGKLSPGVLFHHDVIREEWVVSMQTPDLWPGMNHPIQPLQYGDLLWAETGPCFPAQAISPTLLNLLTGRLSEGETAASFTIQRGANCIEMQQIPVSPVTWRQFTDIWLPNFIIWLGFWILAIIICRSSSHDSLNRRAVWVMGLAAALISQERPEIFQAADLYQKIIGVISILVRSWFAVALVDFSLLFPTPILKKQQKTIRRVFLYLSTAVGVLYLSMRVHYWLTGVPENGLGYFLSSTLGIASLVFLILRILFSIFIDSKPGSQRRLAILVVGILLAVPFLLNYSYAVSTHDLLSPILAIAALFLFLILYFSVWLRRYSFVRRFTLAMVAMLIFMGLLNITQLAGPRIFIKGIELKYLMLFIPLSFAYVIIRYKSFHGSDIGLGSVLILIISASLTNLLSLLLYHQNPTAFNSPPFGELFLFAFPFGLVCSVQKSAWWVMDSLTKRSTLNFQVAKTFSERIAGKVDRQELPGQIVQALTETVKVAMVSFWEHQPEQGFVLSQKSADFPDQIPKTLPDEDMTGTLMRLKDDEAHKPPAFALLRQNPGLEVAACLRAPDTHTLLGLLTFGARDGEEYFDTRDLETLEMIIQLSALQIRSADILQEREVAYHLADQAEEQERIRIARDLHDTTSASLVGLGQLLENIRDELPCDHPTHELAAYCTTETFKAHTQLREILKKLTPAQFSGSIMTLLTDCINKFIESTGLPVESDLVISGPDEFSKSEKMAIYQVLSQSLDNIGKHAHAQHIEIKIHQQDRVVNFLIVDDGCGFSSEHRDQAASDHYGLWSMENRIHQLNGQLKIESSPGEGTRIEGHFPLQS